MAIIYKPGNEPADIKLRIINLFKKLDSAYPDKVIVSLHKQHKHWGETVTALYRELGYESGNEFLQAYGYTIGVSENKGGGQVKNNYTEIIDLLKNKYKSGATCKTIGELKLDNPEYAKAFKTMQNKAKDLFGMSLNDYFKQEGILQKNGKTESVKRKESTDIDGDYMQELTERLLCKYLNEKQRPNSYDILKEDNKDIPFSSIERKYMKPLGIDAEAYFYKHGLIELIDDAYMNKLIDELLSKCYKDLSYPVTYKALKEENPSIPFSIIEKKYLKPRGRNAVEYYEEKGIIRNRYKQTFEIGDYLLGKSYSTGHELLGIKEYRGNNKIIEFPEITGFTYSKAFAGNTSIEEIIIPPWVTSLAESSFEGCTNLKRVTIQERDSLIKIKFDAFKNCKMLESIDLSQFKMEYSPRIYFEGCTLLGENNGMIISNNCLEAYLGNQSIVTIPESVNIISQHAFYKCSELKKVILPNSVDCICAEAFQECEMLSDINLRKDIEIGECAFYKCYSLGDNHHYQRIENELVTIHNPSNVEEDYCISDGIEVIRNNAFKFVPCKTITLADDVKVLDYEAFSCCSANNIILSNSIKEIRGKVFSCCHSLERIVIPECVELLELDAFEFCHHLEEIVLEGNKTKVLFAGKDLSEIRLENVKIVCNEDSKKNIGRELQHIIKSNDTIEMVKEELSVTQIYKDFGRISLEKVLADLNEQDGVEIRCIKNNNNTKQTVIIDNHSFEVKNNMWEQFVLNNPFDYKLWKNNTFDYPFPTGIPFELYEAAEKMLSKEEVEAIILKYDDTSDAWVYATKEFDIRNTQILSDDDLYRRCLLGAYIIRILSNEDVIEKIVKSVPKKQDGTFIKRDIIRLATIGVAVYPNKVFQLFGKVKNDLTLELCADYRTFADEELKKIEGDFLSQNTELFKIDSILE